MAELVVARWEAPEGMPVATGAQQLPDKCFQQVYVDLFVLPERMLCILTLTRTSWANCRTTLMSNDFDIGILMIGYLQSGLGKGRFLQES